VSDLIDLAQRDARGFDHEVWLFDAHVHNRAMQWFIRRKEGAAGAAEIHDLWLEIEQKVRELRVAYLARVKRVAERLVEEAAALEADNGGSACSHVEPPKSAA
jgi:hypothetical protein